MFSQKAKISNSINPITNNKKKAVKDSKNFFVILMVLAITHKFNVIRIITYNVFLLFFVITKLIMCANKYNNTPGNTNMKIIKKLGEGVAGTVYLAEFNKMSNAQHEQYIYKLEKWLPRRDLLKDVYYRQVEFDKFAKRYPNKFMTLKTHGVIDHCKHIQPIPKFATGKFRTDLEKKNKSDRCFYLAYTPIYKYNLKSTHNKLMKNIKLWYKMMYQIIEQIDLMRTAGFTHNDIHSGNIMIDDNSNFHIIDYGMISHKNWPQNDNDKMIAKYGITDISMFLWNVSICNSVVIWALDNNIKFPTVSSFTQRLTKYKEYDEAKKYVPQYWSKDTYNELLAFVIAILNYAVYKKCLGPKFAMRKDILILTTEQKNLLLWIVKHSVEKNYLMILKKIKKMV